MGLSRKHSMAGAACLLLASLAAAQGTGPGKTDTLQKLEAFRSTGGPMTLEREPQSGPRADAIRRNLQ